MNSGRSRKGIALALAVILAFTAGNLMTGCSVTKQTVQTADAQEEEPPLSLDEEGKIREVTEDERIHEIDREKLQKMLPLFRSINELNPEEYGEYENDGPVQIWHKIYLAVTDSVVPDEMGGEYRRMDAAGGREPMFAYAVCEVISGYESWEIRKEERQQFEDRMEQMTPVFQAMMLKKFNRDPANPGLEGEYFPEYDWYRWDMIRTVCTLTSQQEAETGGTVAVDADTVLAYAHALFADTEELPALPADGVTYDANAVMTSEGRTTETGCIFELMENTYTAAGEAPQFPYAVKEITYWYENKI